MSDLFALSTDALTKSEMKILDYFVKNSEQIPFLSIIEISKDIGISNATLTRFVRKAGFSSLKELKQQVLKSHIITPAQKLKNAALENNEDRADLLLVKEIDHLAETFEKLDRNALDQAIDYILNVHHLYIFAKGASVGVGQLLQFRLNRFGFQTTLVHSSGSELFEYLANVKKDDLVILFGFGKIPLEIQIVLDYTHRHTIRSLLFSDTLSRPKKLDATINLYVSRGLPKEYHSMTSAVALVDTLIVELSKKIPSEQYERLHQLYTLKETYKKDLPR